MPGGSAFESSAESLDFHRLRWAGLSPEEVKTAIASLSGAASQTHGGRMRKTMVAGIRPKAGIHSCGPSRVWAFRGTLAGMRSAILNSEPEC